MIQIEQKLTMEQTSSSGTNCSGLSSLQQNFRRTTRGRVSLPFKRNFFTRGGPDCIRI